MNVSPSLLQGLLKSTEISANHEVMPSCRSAMYTVSPNIDRSRKNGLWCFVELEYAGSLQPTCTGHARLRKSFHSGHLCRLKS